MSEDLAAVIERQAAELVRLREALERINDGGDTCYVLMVRPGRCARREIARAALATDAGERGA